MKWSGQKKSINEIFAKLRKKYFRLKEKGVLQDITERNQTFVLATGGVLPVIFNNIDYMESVGHHCVDQHAAALFDRLLKNGISDPAEKPE